MAGVEVCGDQWILASRNTSANQFLYHSRYQILVLLTERRETLIETKHTGTSHFIFILTF